MKNLLSWAGALALVLMPSIALAQRKPGHTAAENGVGPAAACSFSDTDGVLVLCSPTTPLPVSGGSTPSQGAATSGQTGPLVQCATVSGDQAYVVGTTNPVNCTQSGRLKVGLSSATNITPAAQAATTLSADLFACRYVATPPTWQDMWTGAITCDATGAQRTTLTTSLPAGTASIGTVGLNGGVNSIGTFSCTYLTTRPAPAAGAKTDCQTDSSGNIRVIRALTTVAAVDGYSNTSIGFDTNATSETGRLGVSGCYYYNETSWDRCRGSTTGAYVVSKGGSSLATGQVSIGTTTTLIAAARSGRQKITVSVGAANTCAFGPTGITTATGFPLQPTAGASLTLDTAAALYAVCSAATTVSYLEQY